MRASGRGEAVWACMRATCWNAGAQIDEVFSSSTPALICVFSFRCHLHLFRTRIAGAICMVFRFSNQATIRCSMHCLFGFLLYSYSLYFCCLQCHTHGFHWLSSQTTVRRYLFFLFVVLHVLNATYVCVCVCVLIGLAVRPASLPYALFLWCSVLYAQVFSSFQQCHNSLLLYALVVCNVFVR